MPLMEEGLWEGKMAKKTGEGNGKDDLLLMSGVIQLGAQS
jgi:hypothetical protein